jgi:hypothetical protein
VAVGRDCISLWRTEQEATSVEGCGGQSFKRLYNVTLMVVFLFRKRGSHKERRGNFQVHIFCHASKGSLARSW